MVSRILCYMRKEELMSHHTIVFCWRVLFASVLFLIELGTAEAEYDYKGEEGSSSDAQVALLGYIGAEFPMSEWNALLAGEKPSIPTGGSWHLVFHDLEIDAQVIPKQPGVIDSISVSYGVGMEDRVSPTYKSIFLVVRRGDQRWRFTRSVQLTKDERGVVTIRRR